jgi:hypothetical protein
MYKPNSKLKLDIIVSGYEEDKDKIKPVIESLQRQLDDTKREDIGVMFALGQRSTDNLAEIQNKVITTMLNTEFYAILNCTDSFIVMPNYIESLIKTIEESNGDDSVLTLHGINKC